MPLKGLIFDVDGVLVDTVPLHYAAWEQMFSEFGYDFDFRIYREKVDGKSRQDGVRGLMGDAPKELIREAARIKQAKFLENLDAAELEPFPDAVRFFDRLQAQGLGKAAASSSVNAPKVLRKIGMFDEMDCVVTGADITRGKPDPEIFLTAAEQLGLTAAECIVFEDSEAGVEAAKRGRFACVGVDRNGASEFLAAANLIVSSLDELGFEELVRLAERSG